MAHVAVDNLLLCDVFEWLRFSFDKVILIPREEFMTDTEKATFEAALLLAFEAGKWVGQVELEEHYDREQYGTSIIESLYSKKNSMPMHHPSTGRSVTVNLRSNTWREGVRKSANEYLEKAKKLVIKNKPVQQELFLGRVA